MHVIILNQYIYLYYIKLQVQYKTCIKTTINDCTDAPSTTPTTFTSTPTTNTHTSTTSSAITQTMTIDTKTILNSNYFYKIYLLPY